MKHQYKASLLAVICIAWFGLSGCSKVDSEGKIEGGSRTVEIDGCEYLVFENSGKALNNYSFAITHKGNCKNPIHKGRTNE